MPLSKFVKGLYYTTCIPFIFALVDMLPTSCGLHCGNGSAQIQAVVNFLTMNGSFPERFLLFPYITVVGFITLRAIFKRSPPQFQFIMVMYVCLFVPMIAVSQWGLDLAGPTHPTDVNNAWVNGITYSCLFTMLVFVYSGLARTKPEEKKK